MLIFKNIILKPLTRNSLTVFGVLLVLGCSLQESLAMEHDDVEFESRTRGSRTHGSRARGDGSDNAEAWLAYFNAHYTIQRLTRPSPSINALEVVVLDDDGQTTTLQGTLIRDPEGKDGIKQGFALRHRHNHLKPEGDGIEYLDSLTQWYRDTLTYPTFAIQLEYETGGATRTIVLDEFQEVSPTSQSEARNNTAEQVFCQKNNNHRGLDIFVDLTCPLRSGPFREFLAQIPYQRLNSSPSVVVGYSIGPGTHVLTIVEKRKSTTQYRLPDLPDRLASVLVKRAPHNEFSLPTGDEIPLADVKATALLKSSGSLKKQTQSDFGDYIFVENVTVPIPYLYAEKFGSQKPSFFLTRTQEVHLKKEDRADLSSEQIILRFTQKVGVAIEAECVGGFASLNTGLFEQRESAQWHPLSKKNPYKLLPGPFHHLKILKVKTTEPLSASAFLEALEKAADMFYSKLMTLELAHPLTADVSNLDPFPVLDDHFSTLISKTYPSIPLPRNLRALEIGGEDQQPMVIASPHCARFRSLPLNRLTLINAAIIADDHDTERLMENAMEDYLGGHLSEFRIEMTKGHCLEAFDNAPSSCVLKQALEAKRKKQLDQEYERHCRTYRPKY